MAAVAQAWAAQHAPSTSDRPAHKVRSAVTWMGWVALVALLSAVLGDAASALLPGGSDWHERRLARRILTATSE